MDILYRAAMGEQPMEITEPATAAAAADPLKADPLFQQFTAWKELMRLQQKMNIATSTTGSGGDTAPK